MIEVGDAVTVLLRPPSLEGLPTVRLDHVKALLPVVLDERGEAVRFVVSDAIRYSNRTEGTYWIRGHHAEDSPEVRALLAANVLKRT